MLCCSHSTPAKLGLPKVCGLMVHTILQKLFVWNTKGKVFYNLQTCCYRTIIIHIIIFTIVKMADHEKKSLFRFFKQIKTIFLLFVYNNWKLILYRTIAKNLQIVKNLSFCVSDEHFLQNRVYHQPTYFWKV